MLKRTRMTWVTGGLVAGGVIAAWQLRPDLPRPAQEAVLLQVEAGCDSAQRACRARGADLEIEVRLGPPVRPLQTFEIELRSRHGALAEAANAQLDIQFQMRAMDMGLNRYRLQADADGVWRGRAVLPVCSTGRSNWIAQVDISMDGRRWRAELPFTVVTR